MNINHSRNSYFIKPTDFLVPILLISVIAVFLYFNGVLTAHQYAEFQVNWFFYINATLSQFPAIIYNLTQLGDALICLSLLTIFIVYKPKIWEQLPSALIVSALLSSVLKNIFSVPRPAAVFDQTQFVIIGKTLTGHNSLPSGHSITLFTILTVLLYVLMPKKKMQQWAWAFFIILVGLCLVFTRVGVGAHFPIDVISGSIVGYMSGLLGMFINQKYNLWAWIYNPKYYPFFMVLFVVCGGVIISKIIHEPLPIYYVSILMLLMSLYKITAIYVKK
ncbi:MAG: phosphoesterase [Flavobacterium sp. BFFFF2]|nr:MAG: phosphoesterase [Flavobacterium sp. BFFFF2]